jgi:hypothetical protein
MNNSKITKLMQELSQGSKNRPAGARLEDIFDDIEIALNKRVAQEAIWNELQKEDDYKMPLKTFLSAITRIKKKRNKKMDDTAENVGTAEIKNDSVNNKLEFSFPKPPTFHRTNRGN